MDLILLDFEIWESLRKVSLAAVVEAMPDRLDTVLSESMH